MNKSPGRLARAQGKRESPEVLKLDACVELQGFATAASEHLPKGGISNGAVLHVWAEPVERVAPRHPKLEESALLLLVERKFLTHAHDLAQLGRSAYIRQEPRCGTDSQGSAVAGYRAVGKGGRIQVRRSIEEVQLAGNSPECLVTADYIGPDAAYETWRYVIARFG